MNFGVTDKKQRKLEDRMRRCGLVETDIEEKFIRGGGPGGQKVNTASSCVYLRHRPTGAEVKCQRSRSQGLNRFYARRQMCRIIENKKLGDKSPEQEKRQKLRKQKQRRKRRTKKKLKEKHDNDQQKTHPVED